MVLQRLLRNRYYSADNKHANYTKVWEGVDDTGKEIYKAAPMTNDFYHNVYISTHEGTVEDASWWRLRTVFLGYDLPKDWLAPLKYIKGLNITLTGKNLLLWTPYTGNDPEISAHGAGNAMGFDELMVPNTKSFEISAKINF